MAVTILDEILASKRLEVERRREECPLDRLRERALAAPSARPFVAALRPSSAAGAGHASHGLRVIAEIKKASPSKGLIRADFDAVAIARAYASGGAAAISVLTDETYFRGHLRDLEAVRAACDVPLLRKDFVVDDYQIWEARASGADAVLLIVAALDDARLRQFLELAGELDMAALVEVHDATEMERARDAGATLIGVNNRDLRTFDVRIETTRDLLPLRPPGAVFVSESGFSTHDELVRLRGWGVDGFLIGETLMRATDPGGALAELLRGPAGREEER